MNGYLIRPVIFCVRYIFFHVGIHAFFGAFVSGLCIPRKGELSDFLAIRIELIVVEFFLP